MDAVVFVRLAITGGDEFLFTQPSETVEFDAIPSLDGVSVSPAVLDPGRSIGQRETVTVSFIDHLYRFDAEAYDAGTFWTKFRAIYETIQGSTLWVYRGTRGQALADMERRTYIVDALKIGRTGAAITAKDPLALALGKSAQAPAASSGELLSGIDDNDTAVTLTPSGVGNLEYPASGVACIGGSEIVSFTRSADSVTLTSRSENGIVSSHEAGSKFQLVLEYVDATPSEIVNDLLTNYTDVDPAWITATDWETVDDQIGHQYDARIAAPESVTKLLDELSEQIGITLYWDAVAEQIRLISLVPSGGSFVVNDDNAVQDSFDVDDQPDKRITRIWVDYAKRNEALKSDETSNYRRGAVRLADNFADYQQDSIKRIQSRWIALDNQAAANRLTEMQIARYKVPPRTFRFELFRSDGVTLPRLGAGITVESRRLVDADGAPVSIAALVTSESGEDDRVGYQAEEINYDGSFDATKHVILEASSGVNLNLRTIFDTLYSSLGATDDVIFTVQTGALIDGTGDDYTVDVGTWPAGVTLTLVINGVIRSQMIVGELEIINPGFAITTARAITITNNGAIRALSGGIAINGFSNVTYLGAGIVTGSFVG